MDSFILFLLCDLSWSLEGSMNNYFLIHECMPNTINIIRWPFHAENYEMVVRNEIIETNIQHKRAKTEAVGKLSATSGLGRVRFCRRKKLSFSSIHKPISHSAWVSFSSDCIILQLKPWWSTSATFFEDTHRPGYAIASVTHKSNNCIDWKQIVWKCRVHISKSYWGRK